MGKGSFFRGHRPVLSSSSGMFARKGDPWVTDREGQRDFGRTVEIENPDMDADRQRHARIKGFSKEFQDRVEKPVDFKMTMREAIETERSTRLDGYQADKAQAERDKIFKKPKAGQWPKAGKDFQVATVQRKLAAVAMRVKREIRALENDKTTGIISGRNVTGLSARVHEKANIACPYSCGYSSHDSRNISKHLRKHRNQCCTHSSSCNCRDCRDARNDF
jgi:hypothetical protein